MRRCSLSFAHSQCPGLMRRYSSSSAPNPYPLLHRPGLMRRCSLSTDLRWTSRIISFSPQHLHAFLPPKYTLISPSVLPASEWKMDFPLSGLLCEPHLVRHTSIAAVVQAFALFVLLVAGGRFVSGVAVRSAP
ncbi:hypothetical protein K440DRAFT_235686 [Wilcoxina mikolae CBS 423.85]|nr:hypothetical protein K440DRAFT_235686 [Wilcoxina mikolae CBS 423.85]